MDLIKDNTTPEEEYRMRSPIDFDIRDCKHFILSSQENIQTFFCNYCQIERATKEQLIEYLGESDTTDIFNYCEENKQEFNKFLGGRTI